jgi:hypothetical protein
MKRLIIRASESDALLTSPRSKGERLSKTLKTLVEKKVKELVYKDKIKDIRSKYLTKGTDVESKAIKLYQQFTGDKLLIKNDKEFYNDFFSGTPDVILPDMILEFKSSWDCNTFPLFLQEPPRNYVAQCQVYMNLFDIKKARLVYCLVNTPEELINREIYYAHLDMGMADTYDEKLAEIVRKQHTFDDLPINVRIREFEIEYDEKIINKMLENYELANEYYKELLLTIKNK